MSNEKILVIDDEKEIIDFIAKYLLREGYLVFRAFNATEGLTIIMEEKPDAIILDIMLPGMDGLEFCDYLRKQEIYTPILLISAKGDDSDKVLGLGIGADDYITKPFSPNELIARTKAHLRRNKLLQTVKEDNNNLTFTTLEIDIKKREVKVEGDTLYLTAKEFDLISFMARHPNQVFSRTQLYEKIWGHESAGDDRTIMVHIRHVREKVEKNPNKPRYIQTVWGVGYKFTP